MLRAQIIAKLWKLFTFVCTAFQLLMHNNKLHSYFYYPQLYTFRIWPTRKWNVIFSFSFFFLISISTMVSFVCQFFLFVRFVSIFSVYLDICNDTEYLFSWVLHVVSLKFNLKWSSYTDSLCITEMKYKKLQRKITLNRTLVNKKLKCLLLNWCMRIEDNMLSKYNKISVICVSFK